MKGSNSPLLRALYIILIPIVLLIVLLNSGWLQRYVPAATVGGTRYTVVRYNYYYFDFYNTFLNEYADELDELGYDSQTDANKQQYDETQTWEDWFKANAAATMAETAYFNDLAEAEGYTFSAYELAPVAERLAENDAEMTLYSGSTKNYYVSYYGVGMNETRYTEELTRVVQADAYRTYLESIYTPDQSELDTQVASMGQDDYQAASLQIITLEALPDRATGEVGEEQLEALTQRLEALAQRYTDGTSFEALQATYSTCYAGDESGALIATRATGLPEGVADWCLSQQENLSEGDLLQWVDEETGIAWFVRFEGFAGSGLEEDARAELAQQAIAAQLAEGLSSYTVSRNAFGMLLAAN